MLDSPWWIYAWLVVKLASSQSLDPIYLLQFCKYFNVFSRPQNSYFENGVYTGLLFNYWSLTCVYLYICWYLIIHTICWIINSSLYSSLWSSIKEEYNVIQENSIWLLGKGDKINFWNDSWCGQTLVSLFNIPDHITSLLTSSLSDYIHNGHWNIHVGLQLKFPNLTHLVHQITIPIEDQCDSVQWKRSQDGDLQLKEAYHSSINNFKSFLGPN